MNLTPEQQNELHSIVAQHGLDVVLRDLAWLTADSASVLQDDELKSVILRNTWDVHKAADSIVYRAYTGKDLYHDAESVDQQNRIGPF